MIVKSPGPEAESSALREEELDAKLPLMNDSDSLVQHLMPDPFTVDAESLAEGPRGEMLAPATLPIEFAATLSPNFKPGEAFTIQGPLGPIKVNPPDDAEPGMTLKYRLAPRPDFRVQVPQGARPGSEVKFQRHDGVEVSVLVPEGLAPGETFDVTPPSLMVKVPDGASAGDILAFQLPPTGPQVPPQWFRGPVPEGLEAGKYFTARLPMPSTRPPKGHPQEHNWWKSQAKAIAKEPLDFIKALRKSTFERKPMAAE